MRTIKENEKTINENSITVREENIKKESIKKNIFAGYEIREEFAAGGGEADIYLAEKNGIEYILKVYRKGIVPKEEMLKRIKELSEKFPEEIVIVYETGCESESRRYYEVMEYIKNGSLKELYIGKKIDKELFKKIIKEINSALKAIHDAGIIHLDLKPSNILVRDTAKPDLVFTDFGISSFIDKEFSKKMTGIKGTPLYWAPESFTGVVGKASDYWGFGMIIYEIAAGKHPFADLDQKVIMFNLSTRGIDISQEIEIEYRDILKGLLTRNPDKRWGYEEVEKWLAGDKSIPLFFDGTLKGEYNKEYIVNGRSFLSIVTLARYFAGDYNKWQECKRHIKNGQIKNWIEANQDFKSSSMMFEINENFAKEEDFGVFHFILSFSENSDFKIFGEEISIKNIKVIADGILKNEMNIGKSAIIEKIINGKIEKYANLYNRLIGKKSEAELIGTLSQEVSKIGFGHIEIQELVSYINILEKREKFLLPDSMSTEEKEIFVIKNKNILIDKNEWENIKMKFVLPNGVDQPYLMDKNKFQLFSKFLSSEKWVFIEKEWYIKFLEEYVVPEELKEIQKLRESEYIDKCYFIKKNIDYFITKDEFYNLQQNYISYDFINEIEKYNKEEYIKVGIYIKENKQFLITNDEYNKIENNEEIEEIKKGDTALLLSSKTRIGKLKLEAAKGFFESGEYNRLTELIGVCASLIPELKERITAICEEWFLKLYSEQKYYEIINIGKAVYDEGIFFENGIDQIFGVIGEYCFEKRDFENGETAFKLAGRKANHMRAAHGYIESGDIKKGFDRISEAASRGDAEAIYYKGILYEEGNIVEENLELAEKYYKIAADKGEKRAVKRIADFYEDTNFFKKMAHENYSDRKIISLSYEMFGFVAHKNEKVVKIQFIKDSDRLITANISGNIKIWRIKSKALEKLLDIKGEIIAISSVGYIAYLLNKEVVIINTIGTEIKKIAVDEEKIKGCFSENGNILIIYGGNNTILTLEIENKKNIKKLFFDYRSPNAAGNIHMPAKPVVVCAAITNSGEKILSVGNYSEIRLWNLERGDIEKGIYSNSDKNSISAISQEGTIGAVYEKGNLSIYSLENMDKIKEQTILDLQGIIFVDEKRYITYTRYGEIKIWDISEKYFIDKIEVKEKSASYAVWSYNDKILAVGTDIGNVRLFKIDILSFTP